MSNLKKYIEKIKEYKRRNSDISEEKLIRYVYLDLGERFTFDLNFSFGNSKAKKDIYNNCRKTEKELDETMEANVAICKSLAYLMEYILKQLDVDIITEVHPWDYNKYPHVYNVIKPKKGISYRIDLQQDLENIQSHSFTTNFGLSASPGGKPVFQRFEIEQMDRELGFIRDEHYYTDDYLYVLRFDVNHFEDFSEKVQFVLENIDAYQEKNMHYPERKWHHEKLLEKIFSKKELNKIHMIDCYEEEENERRYKSCIAVDLKDSTDIYLYSSEQCGYYKITLEEFAKKAKNGMVNLQNIRGLKQVLKTLKSDDEGR